VFTSYSDYVRAGAVDNTRIVGHEGQTHCLAACGDDAVFKLSDFFAADFVSRGATGFFYLYMVSADEGAVAAHCRYLVHFGHGS
jgi:hypothetical protein